MSTRLSINLGQVYVPFYVQDSLKMECTTVALIPLSMYISGFVISIFIKLLNKHFGRQLSYGFGVGLSFIGSVLILSLDWDGPHADLLKGYIIYVVAVLLGENILGSNSGVRSCINSWYLYRARCWSLRHPGDKFINHSRFDWEEYRQWSVCVWEHEFL